MLAALTRRRSHTRDNETYPISIFDWFKMFRPGQTVNFNGLTHQAFTTAAAGTADESTAAQGGEAKKRRARQSSATDQA